MRVLIVDDDAGVRYMCRAMLESAGIDVTEAANGDEGLSSFRDQPADVVLCDLFMPGRDGLELIREMLRTFTGTKIIAMSGGGFSGKIDLLTVAAKLGAAGILRKPFDKETVLTAIQKATAPSA